MLACRNGDQGAWEELVNRYQRLVYSVPRRGGLTDEQAADVFQHVFASLVEYVDRIEQPERIGAWLVTTARRETWRVGRRERATAPFVRAEPDSPDPVEQLPSEEPLPEETLVRLEEQQRVRVAVDALDERCNRLLKLLFYSPAPPSYAVIAAELGTSEGSIGPTRARCLQKLKRQLEQLGW